MSIRQNLRTLFISTLAVNSMVIATTPTTSSAAPTPTCGTAGLPSLTQVADANFHVDLVNGLDANYAGYVVDANGTARERLSVQISNFTGGSIGLAPSAPDTDVIGDMDAAATAPAYFLLTASALSVTTQTHLVTVRAADSVLCAQTFAYTGVYDTIKAAANKVNTNVVVTPRSPARLGDLAVVTVTGDTGTLGAGPGYDPQMLSITPNAVSSFPAAAWRLERSELTISPDGVLPQVTYTDDLFLTGASGPDRPYTVKYYYRAFAPLATSTPVSPIQFIASGTQVKHTTVDPLKIASLPPISDTTDTTITKTATPTILPTAGTVEFTVRIANNDTVALTIDKVVDTIPATSTYVATSSSLGGTPTGDPASNGSILTWYGPLTIAAGSHVDLVYTLSFNGTDGRYENAVVAYVGNSQIDSNTSLSSKTPAKATVTVGTPAIRSVALAKSASSLVDLDASGGPTPGDRIDYTITATNDGNVSIDTLVVSDAKLGVSTTCLEVAPAATCVVEGSWYLTQADVDAASVDNTAAADATYTEASPVHVEASNTKLLAPTGPSLDATKTYTGYTDTDSSGDLSVGDELLYTITVTNAGDQTATGVSIDDPLTGDSKGCGTLAPGASCTLNTNYTVLAADAGTTVNNTASITATNAAGTTATAAVALPGTAVLSATKVYDGYTDNDGSGDLSAGDALNYTIVATNTGASTALGVFISDALTGATKDCGTVAPAATCTLVTSYALLAGDLATTVNNTATVTASNAPSTTATAAVVVPGVSGPTASPVVSSGTQGTTQRVRLPAIEGTRTLRVGGTSIVVASSSVGTTHVIEGVGTFTVTDTLEVIFVPVGSFVGTRTVDYEVIDEGGRTARSTITVTVMPLQVSGSSDVVPAANNGVLPLTGLPSGAVVSFPPGVPNVQSVDLRGSSVVIVPTAGFSGVIRMPVLVTIGTATLTTEVVLTVLPLPVASARWSNSARNATIVWPASPTPTATGYIVTLNGVEVCRTSATQMSCTVPGPLGPRANVVIRTIGGDDTRSVVTQAVPPRAKCTPIGTIYFATSSYQLTSTAKAELRRVAQRANAQGFTRGCLVGHTDSRGSIYYNNWLSRQRVEAAYRYLSRFLTNGDTKVNRTYRGELTPAAKNDSQANMAKNRRVEIGMGS